MIEKNTKKDLIEFLKKMYAEKGKIPRTIDLQNQKGGPKYKKYVEVFDNWKHALIEAGFNIQGRTFKKYKRL